MPGISQRQIIAWSLAGLLVLIIGAGYLRGHFAGGGPGTATAITIVAPRQGEQHPEKIVIHVVGAVAHPGLYESSSGARVADAIGLAGGATQSADLSRINLAAKIADGQQVIVPEKGAPAAAGAANSSPAQAQAPVNLNSATVDQLTTLDGVGPKTAQKIIEYREAHGGFKNVEDLLQVPGIGPVKLDRIKDAVTV
ncbi:MAG: ComEA family DNA-binding protein [Actinobacteria bacterium]|nr:ComEA family DNA-binding protein [Actinomycetota bacterium]